MENKPLSPEATQEYKPMIKFERGQTVYFRNPKTDLVESGRIMDIDPKTGRMAFEREDKSIITDVDGEETAKVSLEWAHSNPATEKLGSLSADNLTSQDMEKIGETIK